MHPTFNKFNTFTKLNTPCFLIDKAKLFESDGLWLKITNQNQNIWKKNFDKWYVSRKKKLQMLWFGKFFVFCGKLSVEWNQIKCEKHGHILPREKNVWLDRKSKIFLSFSEIRIQKKRKKKKKIWLEVPKSFFFLSCGMFLLFSTFLFQINLWMMFILILIWLYFNYILIIF